MFEITEKALKEFRQILGADENKGLGIKIKAHVSQSCCSCGPSQSYEMGLVEGADDGDRTLDFGGVNVYMDEATVELMSSSEVDFLDGQGFVVKDKAAGPSCGCGGGDYGEHGHGGGSCCG